MNELILDVDQWAIKILLPIFYAFAMSAWGSQEAYRVKTQNIANNVKNMFKGQDRLDLDAEIRVNDLRGKRYTVLEQVLTGIIIVVLFSLYTKNTWYLLSLPIFLVFIKLVVGEGFYGLKHVKDFLYGGKGGSFDDEISDNKLVYFSIKLALLILSGIGYFTNLYAKLWEFIF